MKPSELPEFGAIVDDHRFTALGNPSDDDRWEHTGVPKRDGEAFARDWIDGLATLWDGPLTDEPHLVPLIEVVRRVSALSGVSCPALDESEPVQAVVIHEEGVSDDL